MGLSDWKPLIEGATAVFSLAAAVAGLIAAIKSSSAGKSAERTEGSVNNLRNDLAVSQRQNLQLANAPTMNFSPSFTVNATDVMQRLEPLDARQVTPPTQAPPPATAEGPEE